MSIRETAERFFIACDAGEGWGVCKPFCHEVASSEVQAGALADALLRNG